MAATQISKFHALSVIQDQLRGSDMKSDPCVCAYACVRAYVRAYVRACARARARDCVCDFVCVIACVCVIFLSVGHLG